MTVEELFKGRPVDIGQIMDRLKKMADEVGLPFGERKRSYNSRLAQELGKWAESKGKGDDFHNAIFRAYFAEGENIGKIAVLAAISESLNLPQEEAQSVLESRVFKDRVDKDWTLAREIGVTAVPTLLLDQKALVGAQPYHIMEEFVKDCRVKRRSAAP